MTPQLAARLTIHEPVRSAAPSGAVLAFPTHPRTAYAGGDPAPASLLRREALQRRLLGASDLLAATLALAFVLNVIGNDPVGLTLLVAVPVIVLVFKVAGLYDRDQLRITHSTLDEAPLLLQLTGLFALGVSILEPFFLGEGHLGGAQLAALWATAFVAIAGARMAARWLAGRVTPLERCLVIGDLTHTERIRAKLASGGARAHVVASLPLHGAEVDGLTGGDGIRGIVLDLGIHRVIIAPSEEGTRGMADLVRAAKGAGVRVSVLPGILEAVGSTVEFEDVDGMTMLGVRPFGLSRSSRALKRAFDLIATSVGLLAVAPLFAAIAVAIRLDSRGPVLFRQIRIGRDGRPFHIFKFRSMVIDADAQKDALRNLNEVGDGMFKITEDPRVTRVGSILRKTSLDELPQLLNVMRGEMSLVGPRPLVVDEDAQVVGLDRSRLHLTPGMTGPWQVLGARVPMGEMVGIDYLYVAGWSLWLDLKILVRTVRHVLHSGNV